MTKAFIQNGIVTDIARVDPFSIFQPAYAEQFVDAPDDVGIGWAWDGKTLTAPEVAAPTPEALREAAKAARELAVSQITVTTAAGNTFDGDETSQNRMARAILALQATNTPATLWVLSDNSVIEASVAELAEALALSGAAQSAVWVIE